jgi:protoheme IX farnesyltransferase
MNTVPASELLASYARLGRIRISLASGLSAMTGYFLAAYSLRPELFSKGIGAGLGVFLLAVAASALNQYQEQDSDGLMERTRSRPLPSGEITPQRALLFTAGSGLAGLMLISFASGIPGLLAGLFAIAWYNGLYTNLKNMTAFAAVPGALVGAVPPVIGWQAAGGSMTDPGLVILCIFFFIWQVPHFWLRAASLAEQYRSAGLPAVTAVFSERQLSRILFVWIIATAVSALFLVPYGLALHTASRYLLAATSLGLGLQAFGMLRKKTGSPVYARTFTGINLYMLAVAALLCADRLI